MKSRIHWPAIILAAVLYMALGMAWYMAWSGPWMEYSGISEERAKGGSGVMYLLSFVGAIVYGLTLNWLNARLGAKTFADGAKYGTIIGLVFAFITLMNANGYLMQPVGLGLINGLYPVLAFAFMGGLLAAWQKLPVDAPQASTQG